MADRANLHQHGVEFHSAERVGLAQVVLAPFARVTPDMMLSGEVEAEAIAGTSVAQGSASMTS